MIKVQGPVQPSEHSERFVEHLLYWTTVRSERSLNRSKREIGVFATANKDGGAHRVFFTMQNYSISPRLWAITEEFELFSDTWPFAEQWSFSAQTACCCKQKTKHSLGWTDPSCHRLRRIKSVSLGFGRLLRLHSIVSLVSQWVFSWQPEFN